MFALGSFPGSDLSCSDQILQLEVRKLATSAKNSIIFTRSPVRSPILRACHHSVIISHILGCSCMGEMPPLRFRFASDASSHGGYICIWVGICVQWDRNPTHP